MGEIETIPAKDCATIETCDVHSLSDEESLHGDDIFITSEQRTVVNTFDNQDVRSKSANEITIGTTLEKEARMSNALSSYFSNMILERATECENLTVVVDNAHIPLSAEVLVADSVARQNMNTGDAFSQSLSSINYVAFPPPFLKKEKNCRWESTSSDVWKHDTLKTDSELMLPRRSIDEDKRMASDGDLKMPARSREWRSNFPLGHTPSLDSTVRWLREFPLDLSDHSIRSRRETPRSPVRQESLVDSVYSEKLVDEDEMPLLKKPYLDGDTHPLAILRKLSEGSHDTVSSGVSLACDSEDASIATHDHDPRVDSDNGIGL